MKALCPTARRNVAETIGPPASGPLSWHRAYLTAAEEGSSHSVLGWGAALISIVVLAGTPSRSAANADDATASAQSSAVAPGRSSADRFRVTLPDGAVFELLGVNENPSDGKAWWRPDGSFLERAPKSLLPGRLDTDYPPSFLLRVFEAEAFVARDANVGMELHRREVLNVCSSTRSGSHDRIHYRLSQGMRMRTNSKTTVSLTYASGAWRTVSTFNGSEQRQDRISDGDLVWGKAFVERGKSGIAVTFDAVNCEFRLVALDRDGEEHSPMILSRRSERNLALLSVEFPDLSLANLKEFRFQTRRIGRIAFRNVSLHRGQQTNVEIYVDGKPYIREPVDADRAPPPGGPEKRR